MGEVRFSALSGTGKQLSAGWAGVENPMAGEGMKRPCVEKFDFGLDLRSAKP